MTGGVAELLFWIGVWISAAGMTGMVSGVGETISRAVGCVVDLTLAGVWLLVSWRVPVCRFEGPILAAVCLYWAWRQRPPRGRDRARRWFGNKASAARARLVASMPKARRPRPRPMPA